MARKKKPEEHVNHERWLVSYADFITLLFAFFVVMYSVSSVNAGKYRVLSEALEAAFRSTPRSVTPIQVGNIHKDKMLDAGIMQKRKGAKIAEGVSLPMTPQVKTPMGNQGDQQGQQNQGSTVGQGEGGARGGGRALGEITEKVQKALQTLIKEKLITIRRNKHWVEVEIRTKVLYSSGSASLASDAIRVLTRIAGILKDYPNHIHVEGFTDDRPINTVAFPSNWELSAARAASVVHLFANKGIQPSRMAAVGYGQYRPAADNSTESGRSKNRKVVIVILAAKGPNKLRDVSSNETMSMAPAESAPIGTTAATQNSSALAAPAQTAAGEG